MADAPSAKLLLIVTGSTLRAEDVDRPLAYYLKQQIEQIAPELDPPVGPFKVVVVADFRWLNDEPLQRLPTISVGGPGVNALAGQWVEEELEFSLAVEKRYYIQMDPDLEDLRASVWGMDNPTTQIAASVFIRRFLERFLRRSDEEAIDLEDEDPD